MSLVGQKVTLNSEEWTVDSFTGFSDEYVYLTKPSDPTRAPGHKDLICRRAGDVRRAIELERSSK